MQPVLSEKYNTGARANARSFVRPASCFCCCVRIKKEVYNTIECKNALCR